MLVWDIYQPSVWRPKNECDASKSLSRNAEKIDNISTNERSGNAHIYRDTYMESTGSRCYTDEDHRRSLALLRSRAVRATACFSLFLPSGPRYEVIDKGDKRLDNGR